jgi:hypothetical protein
VYEIVEQVDREQSEELRRVGGIAHLHSTGYGETENANDNEHDTEEHRDTLDHLDLHEGMG